MMRFPMSAVDLRPIRRITDHHKSFPFAVAALVNFILIKCPALTEITIGFELFSPSSPILMYIRWKGWIPEEILEELRTANQSLQETKKLCSVGQFCRPLWGYLHHTASCVVITAEENEFDPNEVHNLFAAHLSDSTLAQCCHGKNGIFVYLEKLPPPEKCLSEIHWQGLGIGNEINRQQRRTPERLVSELPRHLDSAHHAKIKIVDVHGQIFQLRSLNRTSRVRFVFQGIWYEIVYNDAPLNIYAPGPVVSLATKADTTITCVVHARHPSFQLNQFDGLNEAIRKEARNRRVWTEVAFAIAMHLAQEDSQLFARLFSRLSSMLLA